MKNLKYVYVFNWILVGFTFVLYFTTWVGILYNIALGLFQLSIFLYLISHFKIHSLKVQIQLLVYGIWTLITCFSFFIGKHNSFYYAFISSCMLVFFFTAILYQIKSTKL